MRANELRIGIWVYIFGDAVQLTKDYLVYLLTKHGLPEPITLTSEWLLKFGFEKKGPDFVSSRPYFSIMLPKGMADSLSIRMSGEYFEDTFYWGTIQYVHQLQNLYFALTGEELTIKATPLNPRLHDK